jgi:hypothetical protein
MADQTKTPPGVDPSGGAAVDPTRNVLDLVHASIRRVDDLMVSNIRRIDDVAAERVKRLEAEQALRAEYHDKLMIAEAKRIDAIRETDVSAAVLANERATQQADILARQVAQTAEVLRALVDSTAKQIAVQHDQFAAAMGQRVALLEKNQYEAQGKSVATSPMTDELVKEMRASREYRSTTTGHQEGMSAIWGYIIAAIATISMIISAGHILFSKGG